MENFDLILLLVVTTRGAVMVVGNRSNGVPGVYTISNPDNSITITGIASNAINIKTDYSCRYSVFQL